MLSTPPFTKPKQCSDALTQTAGKKPQNNVFFGKFPFKTRNGGKTSTKRTENKPLNIGSNLLNHINELEKQRAQNNAHCILLINNIINQPAKVAAIRDIVAADKSNQPAKYAVALQAIISLFDAGEKFELIKACTKLAADHDTLGRDFLTGKIKPIIIDLQILTQNQDNTFTWSTLEQLQTALPGKTSLLSNIKKASSAKMKQLRTSRVAKKNASNAYLLVKPDGTLEEHRKPFTGELTPAEAKLMREHDAAKAAAELIEKTRKLKDKAAQKEDHAADRQLQSQKQAMWAEAELSLTELQIKKAHQTEKLATFTKPAIAAAVGAVIWIALANMDRMPAMPDQPLEATMKPLAPTEQNYQAPTWEVTE